MNAKHRTALWVLIALTLWTSWLGSGDLALESHEIFVARTSEEMLAREDWVVPWYAEEPRLKKPPLNYWIVMAVDQTGLLGTRGIVSEREARVPSMIGAALLVWATVRLGARAMNERAGLLAGALLASSAGLVQHAHNARPELLYAALCALALERFARSGDESGERVARSAPLIGWALLGLACLTKGPQLPLPMVAGWIIGLSRTIGWRRAISALRPWSGLLIMVAVSIWWPLLVLGTVDDAWSIWNRETIERIAGDDGASGSRLDPYYLYRTPVLIAPWLLIWPLILFWPCFAGRAPRGRGSVRVLHALWWTIVFTMILLSFSAGRRWYYLLPLLAPLCVLAADAAIQFVEGVIRRGAIRSAVLLALGPALLMVLAAAAMMAARSSSGMASVETALALLSAGGALVWLIARIVRATPHPGECASDFARRLLVSAALAVAIVLPGASSTLALWRDRRAEGRDFALAVGQLVPRDAALIGFGGPWDEVRYNLHRTVPCVQDRGRGLAPIGHLLRDSYFLLIEEGIPLPAEAADATRVLAMPRDGEAERLQLWRVDGTATRTQGESRQGG